MKSYGLIGYPLSHSFSASYFNSKFEKENITDATFKLFAIKEIDELFNLLEIEPELCGLSVTIPYKEKVIPLLNEIDETAQKVGAVNSIKITKKENQVYLKGFNTDVIGFEEILLPELKPIHQQALVLGNGGASKAVVYVLEKLNIAYKIVSRNPLTAQLSYNQINKQMIDEHLLIINTTPLGMYPLVDACPDLPYEFLNASHLVIDVIYNPEVTLFMKKAELNGATVQNGMKMLTSQAEASWRIWNSIV
ncbi:MAG: shikimate dehydrogenase [Bacteroidetes bacterium]|nr:shikimate dehydrogenase [Bacteroidota bacterium]